MGKKFEIEITPGKFEGAIQVPPSKSMGHRALICASLAGGVSFVSNLPESIDIYATQNALRTLGAEIEILTDDGDRYLAKIDGRRIFKDLPGSNVKLNCEESGSTLRFLIPLSLLSGATVTFDGRGRLGSRPLDIYKDYFIANNMAFTAAEGGLPFTVTGRLRGGKISMRGDISSQFLTGFLFALPLLEEDSEIILETRLESKSYVDLTIEMLENFGVEVQDACKVRTADEQDAELYDCDEAAFKVNGRQKYIPAEYNVEADYSQAAFWMASAYLGNDVTCEGLHTSSKQGDRVIVDIIRELRDADIKGKDVIFDVSQIPDMLPILSVLGACRNGKMHIINAGRTRLKESDRLSVMVHELGGLGVDVSETHDSMTIKGRYQLDGGKADSHGDHRIAMALAIAACRCRKPLIISDSRCVEKSYPSFWSDFEKVGGIINERILGE